MTCFRAARGVSSPGRTDLLMNVSHIARARYFHEATVVALHQILNATYRQFNWVAKSRSFGSDVGIQDWIETSFKTVYKIWLQPIEP